MEPAYKFEEGRCGEGFDGRPVSRFTQHYKDAAFAWKLSEVGVKMLEKMTFNAYIWFEPLYKPSMKPFLVTLCVLITSVCFAQTSLRPDLSFGKGGNAFINLFDSAWNGMVADFDIDTAGNTYFIANKNYNTDGGSYLSDNIICKINKRGILDSTFYENGFRTLGFGVFYFSRTDYSIPTYSPNFVSLSYDQKSIWVVDYSYSYTPDNGVCLKLKLNGELDSSFGVNGYKQIRVSNGAREIRATPDNGFVIIGPNGTSSALSVGVTKFTNAGNRDSTYNGTGSADFVINTKGRAKYSSAVYLPSGEVFISGAFGTGVLNEDSVFVVKFTNKGKPDSSFGINGIVRNGTYVGNWVINDYLDRIMILPDSCVMVNKYRGGSIDQFKFTKNGKPDTSFAPNGYKRSNFFASKASKLIGRYKDPYDLHFWMTGVERDSSRYTGLRLKQDGNLDSTYIKKSLPLATLDTNGFPVFDEFSIVTGDKITGMDLTGRKIGKLLTNGNVDSSYASNGKTFVQLRSSYEELLDMQPAPDGKMVGIVRDEGFYDFFLFRLQADGSKDSSFGDNGARKIVGQYEPTTIPFRDVSSHLGKILVDNKKRILTFFERTGFPEDHHPMEKFHGFIIERFVENGNYDSAFGKNGRVSVADWSGLEYRFVKAIVQPDNKILLLFTQSSGSGDIAVYRLNEDGSFDQSFGVNGMAVIDFLSEFGKDVWYIDEPHDQAQNMVLLRDGAIVVVGNVDDSYSKYAVKLDRFGKLIKGGPDKGKVTIGGGDDYNVLYMQETDDGKIMYVSTNRSTQSNWQWITVNRLNRDLTADTSYLAGYLSSLDTAVSVRTFHITHDGTVFLGGYKGRPVVMSFLPNGKLNTTLGNNGLYNFSDCLPDTLTNSYNFSKGFEHPLMSMFKDKRDQLMVGITAVRNRDPDVFLANRIINDTPKVHYGRLTCWSKSFYPGNNKILVTVNGWVDSLTRTLSVEPECSGEGSLVYVLPVGDYQLKAICGDSVVSQRISIVQDSCVKKELSFYTVLDGNVTFWTRSMCQGSNKIAVAISNKKDSLTHVSTAEPNCNAANALTYSLQPGTYFYKAWCGADSIESLITIKPGECKKKELVFANQPEPSGVHVFPNPAHNTIKVSLDVSDVGTARILDLNGRLLIRKQFSGSLIEIDISGLTEGFYIIAINGNKTNTAVKFYKSR
ncbi:T9SS type A sorting domain-containing protein [Chitinophagaceae bacterium 26-R-25]|nr:T9SS type A sorting domain-containing protein [Chitinophagaceae bacterium 26-R-25]